MSSVLDATESLDSEADQQALVAEVACLGTHRQDLPWLEWKGRLDVGDKETHAKIAKAVLGFANRNPDLAHRFAGGYGYMLVGVEPGRLSGVHCVMDAAALEDSVARYVGWVPRWRPDYVSLDGVDVLVISVDPPQWGDPIHPVRKTHQQDGKTTIREGTIFIRHQASTAPASATDIDMLSGRAARQPRDAAPVKLVASAPERRDELVLTISTTKAPLVDRLDLTSAARNDYLARRVIDEASRQQAGRPRVSKSRQRAWAQEYIAGLREQVAPAAAIRAMQKGVGAVSLRVANPTEATFVGVELEVTAPDGLALFPRVPELQTPAPTVAPEAVRRRESTQPLFRAGPGSDGRHHVPRGRPRKRSQAALSPDARCFTHQPVTIRAGRSVILPEVCVVAATGTPPGVYRLRWSATATNVPKRISGELEVVLTDTVWTPFQLLGDENIVAAAS